MSRTETLRPTISVERASELLGVSRRSAYRAASRGQIPRCVCGGGRLLVPTQRLLDLLGMTAPDDGPSLVSPRFVIEETANAASVLRDMQRPWGNGARGTG